MFRTLFNNVVSNTAANMRVAISKKAFQQAKTDRVKLWHSV